MIITYSCQTTRALNGRSPEGSFSSTQGVIISGHSRNRLFYHRILFTMKKTRFCESCNRQFSSSYKIKLYACQICGTRFNNHGAEHNHMKIHSNASPFACSLCEKAFAWELSLKKHLISHAKKGDITASMVDEIYLKQKGQHKLNRRAEKRREFEMTDPTMLQQSSTENFEESANRKQPPQSSSSKPFSMPLKDSTVRLTVGLLKAHSPLHKASLLVGIEEIDCFIIEYCFKIEYALQWKRIVFANGATSMHMNTHHGIKAYVCEICGNRFSSHGSKHNHMRRHGNASPFTCPLCQKPFVWELSLKGHLKSHAKQGDITASMVDEIYLEQRTEHKLKKKVQKLCKVLDLMMMEKSSPENCEGVSMPSKKYETHHEATAYNLNTTLPATSDIENQNPQLQQQQTVFHTTAGFYDGPCSSNATYPYNGRYEMINAGNTAENGIPSANMPSAKYETYCGAAAYNPNNNHAAINTNEPYNGRYEIINAGNTAENGIPRCSDANQPYNFRYGVIKAENSAENAEPTASKVMKKDHQMPLSEMSSSTDLCVMLQLSNILRLKLTRISVDVKEVIKDQLSNSNTNEPYNGRYEIINAGNTAENGIPRMTNEDQHPLLQEQQTYFHDNSGLFYGPCSSNATYPYNGRYEMINAGNTAENEDQLSNSNTNEPYNGRYEIINAGNTAENGIPSHI
ncbi:Zinc finger protein [Trichinella zimbabwensis]|uniref:Zinc finger protein n=1 Tax=Trichinella zimbabwensis TaxID=268475 RepID=A0A0V1H9D5_9BILA|nr:Zinc finger protein [Trichinella zimbabwensis]